MKNEGKNRLTLDLPIELHRQIKVRAAQEGLSMRELIERWIKNGLKTDIGDQPQTHN